MGAKQSQDSTPSDSPPLAVRAARDERSSHIPPLFSSLVSNSVTSSSSQEVLYPHTETARQRSSEEQIPPPLPPVRQFFPADDELLPRQQRHHSMGSQDRPRHHHHHHHRHHHQDGAHSQDDATTRQDRPHSHRRQHRERGDRQHHDRSHHGSSSRRARRYVYGEDPSTEPVGMEFDFSLASLNQRLRELQVTRESEGSRSGGSASGSVGRRHGSSRSRSQYASSSVPAGLFFMRQERSELDKIFVLSMRFANSKISPGVFICGVIIY